MLKKWWDNLYCSDKVYTIGKMSMTGGPHYAAELAGPMRNSNYRRNGFHPEELEYYKKYLKTLKVSPEEMKPVAGFYTTYYNPIKRLFAWPLNTLVFRPLEPIVGYRHAMETRGHISRVLRCLAVIWVVWYHAKYANRTWEHRYRVRYTHRAGRTMPGQKGWPAVPWQDDIPNFGQLGFNDSLHCEQLDQENNNNSN